MCRVEPYAERPSDDRIQSSVVGVAEFLDVIWHKKTIFAPEMKKIIESRKLLGIDKAADLKELKVVYRNLTKEWHPDKFQDNDDLKVEAEEKSKAFIEGISFLCVAPETHEQQIEQYKEVVNGSRITDFHYKDQTLRINFTDGSVYEYFGLPKSIYIKLTNSDAPDRFARRHIYYSFLYGKQKD